MKKTISVLGCGRWGSFHAWHADHIGCDALLWGRPGSARLAKLKSERKNEYLTLPESVRLSDSLTDALDHADVVIISVGAQGFRSLCREIAALPKPLWETKTFVLCMKGLELETGKRLSIVLREELGDAPGAAVWVGPGHVQDFLANIPNCMLLASEDESLPPRLADLLESPLIRFYYGSDLLGVEIGAAAKNVVGLAAGMLDGLGLPSLKGALMARGAAELSRLVGAMGGDPMTVYGLSHLGDYEATLFSPHSNNRRFGENLVRGLPSEKLAEGVPTAEALLVLGKKHDTELPITQAVHNVIQEKADPHVALSRLFLRKRKSE